MRSLHMMQRPRRATYEMIGTFAHAGMGRRQAGHREPGLTIESSRGTRYATTFTKLPMMAPIAKAKMAPTAGGS
jgi:hypothetical protein